MISRSNRRICIIPQVSGVGGMVSFKNKLARGLHAKGVEVCDNLNDIPYEAVLVIGGTRQLAALWQVRWRGVKIIQRLDGMNWLHRLHSRHGINDWRHFVRAEYGNLILRLIRSRLATRLVYQSEFVVEWWQRIYGQAPAPARVIYNGVDLDTYTPQGSEKPPQDRWRVLMVEGSLMGGYEQGLEVAVRLAQNLAAQMGANRPVELMVAGRVSANLQRHWENILTATQPPNKVVLNWGGLVESQQIPALDRSAHLLFSSDVNAACPNSVIEALGCGLPVLAFDTGALPELVCDGAGRVVPYGGDPWRLETPDIEGLARAAREILEAQSRFRSAARARAEAAFSLEVMVSAYLEVLLA
jgi:glycosyltransferase involved in cell wall biosynthesis